MSDGLEVRRTMFLLSKRLIRPVLEFTMSLCAVAGITSVLHHPNRDEPFAQMNFHVGGVSPSMPEPFIADSKTQAVTVLHAVWCLLLCEFAKRCFAKVAIAVEFTTIQKHLAEDGRIGCRRKQSSGGHRKTIVVVG